VLVVGLTGGIGAGKSTVGAMLAARGAVVIDADHVAREVLGPGRPAHAAVVDEFGTGVLAPDGSIDRAALASVVFADAGARRRLEAITHPAVRAGMAQRLAALDGGHDVVVLEVPLLAETGRDRYPLAAVVVVEAPPDTAVARLVSGRGMGEADARARVAAQASPEERRAIADRVIDNSGSREELEAAVDGLWRWLASLPQPR
jgi:dephospho-CoA kinase